MENKKVIQNDVSQTYSRTKVFAGVHKCIRSQIPFGEVEIRLINSKHKELIKVLV